MVTAFEEWQQDRSREQASGKPEYKTDEDAKQLADTPHLTGDPEFDAVELAETDPTREPDWELPED